MVMFAFYEYNYRKCFGHNSHTVLYVSPILYSIVNILHKH